MSPWPSAVAVHAVFPLLALFWAFWPSPLRAQTEEAETTNGRTYDIAIVIDNRPLPRSEDARADVDALVRMLDGQMFIEHVMVFERPTIEVICDLFGCPQAVEPTSPFPPLIWQITREDQARLILYYIGDGRVEGLERQLLFSRTDDALNGDVVALSVDWLHAMLEEARPDSAVLMMDAAFAPRPPPCASEDPLLIDDELSRARRNYLRIARDHWNRTANVELSATTPVEPLLCDRFDRMLEGLDQSLFTKFLLKGIVDGEADQGPFGDDDGLIELGELTGYLDDHINRAARFQWGRSQNVRSVGPRSRVLASVDSRDLGQATIDVVARRNRPPEPVDRQEGDAVAEPEEPEPRCGEDSTIDDCHPCVLDPGGAACTERCLEEAGSDLCAPFLVSSTEPDAEAVGAIDRDVSDAGGGVEVVPLDEGNGESSAACDLVAEHVAPYAAVLVQRIRGDVAPTCDWAADRSKVERGPFAQIFTPIAWRLGRSTAQDAVHCLLDCGTLAEADENETNERLGPALQANDVQPVRTQVDPRTLGAFNRMVCDRLHEPLPPYVGIPRWMPGTLIISEALRAYYDCPPPAAEPALPVPLAVAIGPPPEPITPETQPDRAPAVATADDRLARWPPYAVGVDLPPGGGERTPRETLPGVEITDATPSRDEEGLDGSRQLSEDRFEGTVGKVRWLQSALTLDNHNPGPIDGAMGEKTMEAIQSWRRDNNREDHTGELTEVEFRMIIEAFGQRFGQVEARARSF